MDTLRIKLDRALSGQRAQLRIDKQFVDAVMKESTPKSILEKRARGDDRLISMFNALQEVCNLIDEHWNKQEEELEKNKNLKKELEAIKVEMKDTTRKKFINMQKRLDERNDRIQKMFLIIYQLRERNDILRKKLKIRKYLEGKELTGAKNGS